MQANDVFGYLDYRAFLRDYYLDRKDRRGLSFRAFSKRAGLRSPNYLKLVIDGIEISVGHVELASCHAEARAWAATG